MARQARALAVHDLSCVGKCSLTVALPVLSAAGVETAVLPTAVLSTHTGGFGPPAVRDLTEDMAPIAAHWQSFGLTFDAVYTGYLAPGGQVEAVLALLDAFGQDAFTMVDPAMADHGRLYRGFDSQFPAKMARLCRRANLILPNATEAALLLGEEPSEGPCGMDRARALLERLAGRFPGSVVLTGVTNGDSVGAATLDRASGEVSFALVPRLPGEFHGTGDLFASALLASLLRGRGLGEGAHIAARFTAEAIRVSGGEPEKRYGLAFERALPALMEELGIFG